MHRSELVEVAGRMDEEVLKFSPRQIEKKKDRRHHQRYTPNRREIRYWKRAVRLQPTENINGER